MRRRLSWKWVAAHCAVMVAVAASIAFAAPSGGDRGDSDGGDNSEERSGEVRRAGPERHLSALADELGVSSSRLRDALEAIRDDREPPRRPPSRAQAERRCTELTDALASELNLTGDKVRSAIKSVIKEKIEAEVDAGRLPRQRAQEMLDRLDSAECLPPFGPGLVHGCAGRPGHRPGPPDGAFGEGRGTALPAPPPGALPL
jgi:hypothetical protein